MDITTKNAEFQEKSTISLDYLLRIQIAHDIFNIWLNSSINVYMSRKNYENIIFTFLALIDWSTIIMYLT